MVKNLRFGLNLALIVIPVVDTRIDEISRMVVETTLNFLYPEVMNIYLVFT
jgi:hypothetical protein